LDFSEWLIKQKFKPTPVQVQMAKFLDFPGNLMVSQMPLASGKTWLLKNLERYIHEQRQNIGAKDD